MAYGKILADKIQSSSGKISTTGELSSELESIARSLNVADSAVIYGDDTVTLLDNVSYIYDATAQTTWGIPVLDSTGKTIVSVVGSVLTTTGGTGGNSYALKVLTDDNFIQTVADMKSLATLSIGDVVSTSGYTTIGDGGANDYEVVAAGTSADDGGSYIDLAGSGLQAKGLFNGGLFVEQFGANPTTDSSPAINSALVYVAAVKGVLKALRLYPIASTVTFPAAEGYSFSSPSHQDLGVSTKTGFKWIGGNNTVAIEFLDFRLCNIDNITVSNADTAATGCTGILWHNADNTLNASNLNKVGNIYVDRFDTGVQLGDYANDGYDSNVDDNEINSIFTYNTTHPLLIDSTDQDNNVIGYFHAGGVPALASQSRDYIIRATRNGIGFRIIDGFAVGTGLKTDADALDIQSGSFSCDKFSIESSDKVFCSLNIGESVSRDQTIIKEFTTADIKDSTGLSFKMGGRSGMIMIGCSVHGDVQYTRPLIAINTVLISGNQFIESGSNGSVMEIGTKYRADANSIVSVSQIVKSDGISLKQRSQQTTATVFTNLNLGAVFPVLLTANVSVSSPTNVIDSRDVGREIEYVITGDSVSAYTVTFNAIFKTAGSYTHSGVNLVDVIAFRWDGSNWRETRRSLGQSI